MRDRKNGIGRQAVLAAVLAGALSMSLSLIHIFPGFYMVQTGVFRLRSNAEAQLQELKDQGFPAFMTVKDGLFYVRAGAFREMDNAVQMERRLRPVSYTHLDVYKRQP